MALKLNGWLRQGARNDLGQALVRLCDFLSQSGGALLANAHGVLMKATSYQRILIILDMTQCVRTSGGETYLLGESNDEKTTIQFKPASSFWDLGLASAKQFRDCYLSD